MLKRNYTVSSLFNDDIKYIKYQKEDLQVLATANYAKSLKKLEIDNFSTEDMQWILGVVEKPEIPGYIIIPAYKELLENFGLKDYENMQDTSRDDGVTETDDPRQKKNKKGLNYDDLTKESLNILTLFTDYLLDTDTSVYEFFEDEIYNQLVRTKNKQITTEIVPAVEFFKKIKENKKLSKLIKSKYLTAVNEGKTSWIIFREYFQLLVSG